MKSWENPQIYLILHKGEYGLYAMTDREIYISSEYSILNITYQEKTK